MMEISVHFSPTEKHLAADSCPEIYFQLAGIENIYNCNKIILKSLVTVDVWRYVAPLNMSHLCLSSVIPVSQM